MKIINVVASKTYKTLNVMITLNESTQIMAASSKIYSSESCAKPLWAVVTPISMRS